MKKIYKILILIVTLVILLGLACASVDYGDGGGGGGGGSGGIDLPTTTTTLKIAGRWINESKDRFLTIWSDATGDCYINFNSLDTSDMSLASFMNNFQKKEQFISLNEGVLKIGQTSYAYQLTNSDETMTLELATTLTKLGSTVSDTFHRTSNILDEKYRGYWENADTLATIGESNVLFEFFGDSDDALRYYTGNLGLVDGAYVSSLLNSEFNVRLSYENITQMAKSGTSDLHTIKCTLSNGDNTLTLETHPDLSITLNRVTTPTAPPATPTNVTAEALSTTSIKVSWDSVASANFYKLYQSDSADGTYTLVAGADNITATNFTVTGLTMATKYYYKVASYVGVVSSRKSDECSAITYSNIPTGLYATALSTSSIKVNWNSVFGATSYKVYRASSKNGTYTLVTGADNVLSTNYTVTGLTENTTYYFKVSAYDGTKWSELSIDCSATTISIEEASSIYVSTAGSDSGAGTKLSPYSTIQKALDMVTTSKYNICVAMGTYSEAVEVISTIPTSIKGGFNSSWIRENSDDKSIIRRLPYIYFRGTNGTLTMRRDTNLTLENLYIAGNLENTAKPLSMGVAVNYNCTLTLNGCDIVGKDGNGIVNEAWGVRVSSGTLIISNSRIVGAVGDLEVTGRAFALKAYDSVVTMRSGEIVAATDNVNVLGNTTPSYELSGIHPSAAIYSEYNNVITIISGEIYGISSSAIAREKYAIYKCNEDDNQKLKLYKGTPAGTIIIQNAKGVGTNLASSSTFWSTP